MRLTIIVIALAWMITLGCAQREDYDIIIRNGMIYDGTGSKPYKADLAINADTIAFIGDLSNAKGRKEIDAEGKQVTPGFINMLSWANESLIEDGRSMSNIHQGVTLEIMGEGWSMGPFNDALKKLQKEDQTNIRYDIEWTTLGEFLKFLEKKGISTNVASYVGATTVRTYVIGEENRKATPEELQKMRRLVREAMEEGALGLGTSLIYPPGFFADTEELIELSKEVAAYDGIYISHMRNEGNKLLEAVDELITIAREAGVRAEIFHLKAAGKNNFHKIDQVIEKVENARKEGLAITADMYTYTAGATGMTAGLPPSLEDGGFGELRKRLMDPAIRKKMEAAMRSNPMDWDNLYYAAGSPENVILLSFRQDSLKKYIGKSLAEVAKIRGTNPEATAIDLIIQDSSRLGVAYYFISEENLRKQIQLPWMSFGSDASSQAPEGNFLQANPHPRAYGNFARLLEKYVREEQLITLEEAVYKLSGLPATNLKLHKRGFLKTGYYADVNVFDIQNIKEKTTFSNPHQLSEGMDHVFVNGGHVLENGKHTGIFSGRFVKGPGAKEN
jgi:N-acyl-D-amino-acid deacylase